MQLSIIIPVYNVEKYIRPCLESVFRQGLEEECFEVLLVDDGTKDKSLHVIADIIGFHKNIKILTQENQGLSAARNTGMREAKGEYVLFLDSDDLLVDNTLPILLRDAIRRSADLLIAGFVKMTDSEIEDGRTVEQKEHLPVEMTGQEAFVNVLNPRQCYVWRALYRREFLSGNDIHFIHGIYFEDVPYTTECYLKAGRCVITNYIFYIYRQRNNSIVSAINKKKVMDFNHVLASLWEMRQWKLSESEQRKLMDTIFSTFSVEMWYVSHSKELLAERKEITADLKAKVPALRFTNGLKQKVVSACFGLCPNVYIKMLSLKS